MTSSEPPYQTQRERYEIYCASLGRRCSYPLPLPSTGYYPSNSYMLSMTNKNDLIEKILAEFDEKFCAWKSVDLYKTNSELVLIEPRRFATEPDEIISFLTSTIKKVLETAERERYCDKIIDGNAICGVKLDCHLHDWRNR